MDTNNQRWRLKKFCSHLGGGNPFGGIWIIGIEEGGAWENESEIDCFIASRQDRAYDYRKPGDPEVLKWKISRAISMICFGVTGFGDSWEDFRREHYLTRNGPFFNTNLYPLAKPLSSAIPGDYKTWFGIENAADYREKVIQYGRFDLLLNLWEQCQPRLTICHGKGFWHEFRSVLGLRQFVDKTADSRIEIYDRGVFLTPHLSWSPHMPDMRIAELVKKARPYWQNVT